MRVLLSPYGHELHYTGLRCADDCPACAWAELRKSKVRRKKKLNEGIVARRVVTSVSQELAVGQGA